MNIKEYIQQIAIEAKKSFYLLAKLDTQTKNKTLQSMADYLKQDAQLIIEQNKKDILNAQQKNLNSALLDRLTVTAQTIDAMIIGIKQIISLPDPIGEMSGFHSQPSGILVGKMRVPLGVIGMIYESRPNVTIDAFALCFKSGNAVILRGGSESFYTNSAIVAVIKKALQVNQLPTSLVAFVNNTDRESVGEMLKAVGLIDVIIPRGGAGLVKRVAEDARVPVIKHLDGICHIYIDKQVDIKKALEISINAKTSRYGTCNTMETLLCHQDSAELVLTELYPLFLAKNVELRGCGQTLTILPEIKPATAEDWRTEYLAAILSIKVVADIDEAIEHINTYGSHHTDTIITENYTSSMRFLREVDSASVMVNASTRFADGFEYGLGAEIGISTDKIHARGPVGLLGLTSEKWVVLGNGQIRV